MSRVARWALVGLLLGASPALAALSDRRLEAYPAESWLRPATTQLRCVAGRPSLAGASSEMGLEGEIALQPALGIRLAVGSLRAASYREEHWRAGLVFGSNRWGVQLEGEGSRGLVEGLVSESTIEWAMVLALHSGPISVALRRLGDVGAASRPEQTAWVLRWRHGGVVLALLREDARWGGDARWSAGIALALGSALELGMRGDDAQGQLHLRTRVGSVGLRLSVPVASIVAAGPYLALEWTASSQEHRR